MSIYRKSASEKQESERTPIAWAKVGGSMLAGGMTGIAAWLFSGACIFFPYEWPVLYRFIVAPLAACTSIWFTLAICADGPSFHRR